MATLRDARRDVLRGWQVAGPEVWLNEQEFRFTALRDVSDAPVNARFTRLNPKTGKTTTSAQTDAFQRIQSVNLGGVVEAVEWRDEGSNIAYLQGSVTVRKPHHEEVGGDEAFLREGDRIKCEVFWAGSWREVWTMRVYKPTVTLGDGQVTYELADDLFLLMQSRATFVYRRGKKRRKKGYRYDEIVKLIARRFGFSVRAFKGKLYIKDFRVEKTSPFEAIRQACEKEARHTGRRYVIAWRDNRVVISQPRRNPLLYRFGPQVLAGSVADVRKGGEGQFATMIVARGVVKTKGKAKSKAKRRKVVEYVGHSPSIRQYGYIQRSFNVGTVDSITEFRQRAAKELARSIEIVKTVQITHPGIAFIRKMDACTVEVPWEGLTGYKALMYVQSVTHSLTAGDYSMDLTLAITDPLDPTTLAKERKAAALRREKEAKRRTTREKNKKAT